MDTDFAVASIAVLSKLTTSSNIPPTWDWVQVHPPAAISLSPAYFNYSAKPPTFVLPRLRTVCKGAKHPLFTS